MPPKKVLVDLTEQQIKICKKIQREAIEIISKYESLVPNNKRFELIATSIGLIICNFLHHFGIEKSEVFMKDLSDNINYNYDVFQSNTDGEYVIHDKGKKVHHGKLN